MEELAHLIKAIVMALGSAVSTFCVWMVAIDPILKVILTLMGIVAAGYSIRAATYSVRYYRKKLGE